MIESKKTCRTIQQSALSSSTQHLKSMTTDTQFNTIMRSVKTDTRLYTQKVLKKHQNKLLNARNISTKTQTKNPATNDARIHKEVITMSQNTPTSLSPNHAVICSRKVLASCYPPVCQSQTTLRHSATRP